MKKINYLIVAVVAFVLGSGFAGAAISLAAPKMLIKEAASPFDFEKTVRLIESRINAKPGWHVITTYDQNAEVTAHGGQPIGPMAIIKYCSGSYASRMLAADDRKKLSSMMPKSISVYEDSRGQVHVAMSNGAVMGKLYGGETQAIIEEVSREIEEIMGFMHFKFSTY